MSYDSYEERLKEGMGVNDYDKEPVISINQETIEELLLVLNHQFIPHEYTKVHAFIKRAWEFTGK